MTALEQQQLGKTLWAIADDFRDYMLSFLFLRYLSDNYEQAAKKELGEDYPLLNAEDKRTPLAVWYKANAADIEEFEKQMRRKVHYVIESQHLWTSISELARRQDSDLLITLQKASNILKMNLSKVLFKACSPKSTWTQISLVKTILNVISAFALSFKKLLKVLLSFLPILMF